MDFKSKFLAFWQRDEHERYSELCALSTAGALTDDERNELNTHVRRCSSCAELLRAYRAVARSAMPLAAPAAEPVQEQKPWSVENAKKQLLNRIEAARAAERPKFITAPARRRGLFAPGKQFLPATAAMAALLAVLAPVTSGSANFAVPRTPALLPPRRCRNHDRRKQFRRWLIGAC